MVEAHPKPSHSDPYEGKEFGEVIEEKVAEAIATLIKMVDGYVSTKITKATALSIVLNKEEWWEMERATQKELAEVIDMALGKGVKILQMVGIKPGGPVYCLLFDNMKSCVLKLDCQLEIIRDITLLGSNSPKFLKKYNEPEYHRRCTIIVQRMEEHAQQLKEHAKQLGV
jgi:hypothetical protein